MAFSMADAFDSDMLEGFSIKRRSEAVGANGRSTTTSTPLEGLYGVITVASSSDLARHPELQITNRTLSIVTREILQGEAVGRQPDLVTWRGSDYIVKAVDPYPHFGDGFYQAICESLSTVDPTI